jgi:membrane associated rhomboid family serine protease
LVVIGMWFVLQLYSGVGTFSNAAQAGGVAYMAHIGGFIAGLIMALILR